MSGIVMNRLQFLSWSMAAMCLLVAACTSDDRSDGRNQTDAFCFNEQNNTAAHTRIGSCANTDRAKAYMRDFGGCYWDDYAITESEYVTALYTREQPASIEAREARWTYCYDPSINFVYAQQEKACSSGDDSIDRSECIERIRNKHAS